MASYEKPVNQIDFGAGERPEVDRQEEEFMYKYMKMRGPLKIKPTAKVDENGDVESDSGISDFAQDIMQKKMKEEGSADIDSDADFDYSVASGEEEDDGLFGGENDLEDVEIDGDSVGQEEEDSD